MQEKQRTVPAPNLKVHFMISSTQHLNIYSSLKIYLSTTNAQRVYSISSKIRWRVVTHHNRQVQVSPAYLCIQTRPMHKQYTPAFHHCTGTLPKQSLVSCKLTLQWKKNNSLPTSCSPSPSFCQECRIHWTSTNVKLHLWPTDITAFVGMDLSG